MPSLQSLLNLMTAYVPILLGLVIGVVMVSGTASAGPERSRGLFGLSLMLAATLLRMIASFVQSAMFAEAARGAYATTFLDLFMVVFLLLNLLSVAGLLVLIQAFCKALPRVAKR